MTRITECRHASRPLDAGGDGRFFCAAFDGAAAFMHNARRWLHTRWHTGRDAKVFAGVAQLVERYLAKV